MLFRSVEGQATKKTSPRQSIPTRPPTPSLPPPLASSAPASYATRINNTSHTTSSPSTPASLALVPLFPRLCTLSTPDTPPSRPPRAPSSASCAHAPGRRRPWPRTGLMRTLGEESKAERTACWRGLRPVAIPNTVSQRTGRLARSVRLWSDCVCDGARGPVSSSYQYSNAPFSPSLALFASTSPLPTSRPAHPADTTPTAHHSPNGRFASFCGRHRRPFMRERTGASASTA